MPPGKPRQSRLLLRRSSKRKSTGIVNECELFLSSSRLGNLLSGLPNRKAQWETALTKALSLWESLQIAQDDTEKGPEMLKAIWETVCVLVKANFYLQNNLPLERIHAETFEEFAMHAVVGLTSVRSTCLWPVMEHLLRAHVSQLQVKEPIRGRLPLHVAASTPYKSDRYEILVGLIEANPAAAAEMDDQGIFPLHLACQAKYPWKQGLESLYKAAPHVGELNCPCCPAELLAKQDCYDQSLETVYALVQTDETLLS